VTLVALALGVPWIAAVAALLVDGRRRAVGWAAVAALTASVVVLAVLGAKVWTGGEVAFVSGGWPADLGIRLRVDALGAILALVSAVVVALALAYEVVAGVGSRTLPALVLFLATGLNGLFLTGDLFSFYVFFELAMISAYALAAYGGGRRQVASAFIFAVVNLLGSFIFLISVAALYRTTGTLEMSAIAERFVGVEPTTGIVIAIGFLVAFSVKLGLFPFHFWLPAVYVGVRPAVSAILSGALANIGAYGLLRFGGELFPAERDLGAPVLIGVGLAGVIYGSVQAISRRQAREVLAYSAIGQGGYLLVAIGVGGTVGFAAGVIFAVANALTKGVLFLSVELRGWLVGGAFLVGALSVAGVPPSAGFFGKLALFDAGVEGGWSIVVLLIAGGALAFVYIFQILQHEFWRPETAQPPTATLALRMPAVLLAGAVLALGLWPEPLLAAGDAAARVLGGGGP
jgi:multicomponent Na+:H+ antiporter subunit D